MTKKPKAEYFIKQTGLSNSQFWELEDPKSVILAFW
jgi:hypothetical protein